jgi:hypothetical protein
VIVGEGVLIVVAAAVVVPVLVVLTVLLRSRKSSETVMEHYQLMPCADDDSLMGENFKECSNTRGQSDTLRNYVYGNVS